MQEAFVLHLVEPYLNSITRFICLSALDGENRDETMPMPDNFFQRASEYGHVDLLEYFKDHIDSTSMSLNSRYPIDYASQYCHTDVLDWWKNSNKPLVYSHASLDEPCLEHGYRDDIGSKASVDKQLKRLNWWLSSGLELKYTVYVIDMASGFNWIVILDRWLESGLELKYTHRAMDLASRNGCVDSLEWWKRSKLPLKYYTDAMDLASEYGHIDVLQWWKASGLFMKHTEHSMNMAKNTQVLDWWNCATEDFTYSPDALTEAAANGDISKLEWWWNFDRSLYSGSEEELIYRASEFNHPSILQWLYDRLDEFIYSDVVIDTASEYGSVAALEWWKNSGLELRYTEDAMIRADHFGDEEEQIITLNWWKNSGLPLQYDETCILLASYYGYVKILQWWLDSGLSLRYDTKAMDDARDREVLDWWLQSGLELKYTRNDPERHLDVVEWWQKSGLDDL